jgi:hypothetical protein
MFISDRRIVRISPLQGLAAFAVVAIAMGLISTMLVVLAIVAWAARIRRAFGWTGQAGDTALQDRAIIEGVVGDSD